MEYQYRLKDWQTCWCSWICFFVWIWLFSGVAIAKSHLCIILAVPGRYRLSKCHCYFCNIIEHLSSRNSHVFKPKALSITAARDEGRHTSCANSSNNRERAALMPQTQWVSLNLWHYKRWLHHEVTLPSTTVWILKDLPKGFPESKQFGPRPCSAVAASGSPATVGTFPLLQCKHWY